jgi:hypothetical protein
MPFLQSLYSRTSWKGNSTKYVYRILYARSPNPLRTRKICPISPRPPGILLPPWIDMRYLDAV